MTTGAVVAEQPRTLADLRKAANLTSDTVGERMGVNGQRVRHIEAKYPNLNFGTLLRYIEAIGGDVQLVVGSVQVSADGLDADPTKRGTRKYLLEKASRPGLRLLNSGSLPEELPLQGDQPDPGGDDTGGQVDHPDPESDQGDSGQRQEP